ncbi:hypothetical protein DICPUDRAFT_90282 [Dictyostelium purpureum]|uniref:Uncharacterized protein n=1 Tax=Dictyostelium purpureum TaxID=5786 RepID=F1A1I7_DICPU|nr:uncharacterized protein DICPUDRAFT_90282 [Dictyostelium purpureum]EGC29942.1 hypothetical protein DICPUDRAFT_90282 [Dictyostelium purpureum]|eukprot:XP_003293523.1 hypothetical protein DICPUDRAFT_90282 [Dictyostelium purpureum]
MVEYGDDQELVANELLQMQNESYWLIQREVPTVCKRVRTIVNKCLELLHPIDIKSIEEGEEEEENKKSNNNGNIVQIEEDNEVNEIFDILKFSDEDLKKISSQRFETSEGSRGTINLNGWLIDTTDLYIKTRCRTNNPVVYKDTISKNTPWRLSQIQNAYNHLRFVEAELSSIISFSERYQPVYINQNNSNINNINNNNNILTSSFISDPINNYNNNNSNNEASTSSACSVSNNSNINNNSNIINNNGVIPELLSLFETVKSIGEWISMAKDELLLPSRDIFPHTLFQKNVLKNLPPDIHIDITVANCDILFSVHELQISSTDSGQSLGGIHHSGHSNSPSKFLRKSTSGHKAVGGGSPHPPHMSQQLNGQVNGSSHHGHHSHHSHHGHHQNGGSPSLSNSNGVNSGSQQSPLSSSGSSMPRNNSGLSLNTSSNSLANSGGVQDLNSSSNNISNTSSPNLGTLLESEEYHHPPDQLSKKTYQMNRSGNTQYVTIIDHSESRIPIKKLSDSFALMTSAYDKLADLSEKFMVLSNTS